MALIDEDGMLRVMKDAYKATGYIVINDAGTVTIRTGVWMTQMPFRVLPRKVLALLVEHIGTIPEDETAFRCSKSGGAQTLVFAIEQENTKKAEAYFGEAMPIVKETQLVFKDCRIWQVPELREMRENWCDRYCDQSHLCRLGRCKYGRRGRHRK